MKCDKCDGVGWKDNPKYWNAKEKYQSDWYIIYDPRVNCRKCRGTGYIIGNPKEVLEFLRVLELNFANDKERLREIKQCIDVFEK